MRARNWRNTGWSDRDRIAFARLSHRFSNSIAAMIEITDAGATDG